MSGCGLIMRDAGEWVRKCSHLARSTFGGGSRAGEVIMATSATGKRALLTWHDLDS